MSECLKSDSFVRSLQTGNLGTHSIKKAATTHCNRNSVPKDSVDYRARWMVKRVQDRYTDSQLDWPDIQAAMKLCDGGVAFYKPKDGSGITDAWLAREVAPHITQAFGITVGAILGRALLWACHEPSAVERVSPDVCGQVIAAWGQRLLLPRMENRHISDNAELKRRIRRLEDLIRTMVLAPARRLGPNPRDPGLIPTATATAAAQPATLSKHPRTLQILWHEWQNTTLESRRAHSIEMMSR